MADNSQACEVGSVRLDEFAELVRTGLAIKLGPFVARVVADCRALPEPLYDLYRYYEIPDDSDICSFQVRIDAIRGFPNLLKRSVRFTVDGKAPHEDMPYEHALPVLEWGINLVTALRSHCFIMLHAAAAEIDGSAVIMPGEPGSGKSTLCAGLALSGWRLLSDEFGMVRPGSREVFPYPRPIALKNESIDIIRDFSDDAFLGPEIFGTRKGTVAHFRPPSESIRQSDTPAPIRWIIFPRWQTDVASRLVEIPKAEAFMLLATNAFNYELIGEAAFRTLTSIVDAADCYYFEYSDLSNATAALTDFVRRDDL